MRGRCSGSSQEAGDKEAGGKLVRKKKEAAAASGGALAAAQEVVWFVWHPLTENGARERKCGLYTGGARRWERFSNV